MLRLARWNGHCILAQRGNSQMSKYAPSRDLDLSVRIKWVVVASRIGARVFKDRPGERCALMETIDNPEGRAQEADLTSDRPGRNFSANARDSNSRHSLDAKTSQHEIHAERFAALLADRMDLAFKNERFSELVLVAEPHFLGLLRGALSPAIRAVLSGTVPKDFSRWDVSAIRERLSSL